MRSAISLAFADCWSSTGLVSGCASSEAQSPMVERSRSVSAIACMRRVLMEILRSKSLSQFENNVHERGAIVRLTVLPGGPIANVLRGGQGGIVQAISQSFNHAIDVQRAGSSEHDIEEHLTLDAHPAGLGSVGRARFVDNLDALHLRLLLHSLRAGSALRNDDCAEAARH